MNKIRMETKFSITYYEHKNLKLEQLKHVAGSSVAKGLGWAVTLNGKIFDV